MIGKQIAETITSNYHLISAEENNSELNFNCRCNDFIREPENLKRQLDKISNRDTFTIEILFGHTDNPSSLSEKESTEIEKFLDSIKRNEKLIEENETAIIKIKISKNTLRKTTSVYSLEHLVDYWSKGSPYETLEKISSFSKNNQELETFGIDRTITTSLFRFIPAGLEPTREGQKETREDFFLKRDKICHFANGNEFDFIPGDFRFAQKPPSDRLEKLFKSLSQIFSLIYICNYSKIDKNGNIELKLNGYKQISKTISSLTNLNTKSSEDYFEIFSWAYKEGNISDKVGIARNIISIHLSNDDLLEIQDGAISSIQSNYQIYLKDNLKQYIDIKSKISESIQKSSDKAGEMVKQIGTQFRASIFSIYSFFFTVFLLRAITKNEADFSVSTGLYVIFILFIAITIAVYFYSLKELKKEETRFKSSYASLKKRYSDLISESDLKRILNNDKDHEDDLDFINQGRISTAKLWRIMILVIAMVMTALWLK
ncbi:hypothetical protein NNO07_16085 [Pseudomonas resinovorans]|uniref:Uncharacterized protein n=1 Tax=Metapseudomonas resinovorans TaxID=53412 RepID=A0ABT4Y7H7_METRE|nr:hypothetical protein [Pseudomonas resinovorans]MDA8484592.1 hypothetical protein [Pseudomonas resinovorans]